MYSMYVARILTLPRNSVYDDLIITEFQNFFEDQQN